MASDNTAGQTGTRTADAAQTTQQMAPVPVAPKTSGTNRTAPPSAGGASAAETSAASSAATPANGAPASGSAVKDGAVKAAAAALAAARNAAKKVQSTASGSSTGAEPPDAASAGPQSAPPAPASTTQSAPRPEMHYSAGGVHGGAQAEASPAGGAQYAAATGSQPGARPAAAPAEGVGSPRRVRLSVSRIDPWSIMKLAFLLSVAIGIMIVVATAVVWYSLNSLGTFATIQEFLIETMGPQTVNITQFVELERMLSLSTLIALVNMVLFTAIATIMAILYNITAALVGGVHLTLTDD